MLKSMWLIDEAIKMFIKKCHDSKNFITLPDDRFEYQ